MVDQIVFLFVVLIDEQPLYMLFLIHLEVYLHFLQQVTIRKESNNLTCLHDSNVMNELEHILFLFYFRSSLLNYRDDDDSDHGDDSADSDSDDDSACHIPRSSLL